MPMIAIGIYLGLWIMGLIAAVIFFIWVLNQRIKEKKIEEKKHKDYDKY